MTFSTVTAFYDTLHSHETMWSEVDQREREVNFIYLSIKFNIIDCQHIIVQSAIKQDNKRHMVG